MVLLQLDNSSMFEIRTDMFDVEGRIKVAILLFSSTASMIDPLISLPLYRKITGGSFKKTLYAIRERI